MWFEVFKTGEHSDSSGNKASYSEQDLDKIATIYNSRIKENPSFQAPVVKGHPKNDDPAYGWVEMLKRKGNSLFAKVKQLAPEIINEIKQGRFKNISIALYPDLLLRHIGLLGAIPPAVKGLQPVTFNNGDSYASFSLEYDKINCFDYSSNEDLEKEYFSALEISKQLRKENDSLKEKLFSLENEKRLDSYKEFACSLLKDKANKQEHQPFVESLVEILDMAYAADEQSGTEFSSSKESKVSKVKEFALSFAASPLSKEFAIQNESPNSISSIDFSQKKVDPEKLEIHNKAIELQLLDSALSYQEALKKISV